MRPVFVVDFDGTCIDDNHYPEMGEWLPGAVEALHELLKHGEVLIYTLRVNPYERYHDGDEAYLRSKRDVDLQLSMIYDMLDAEGLHEVGVHMTKGKPAGTYYIDNQAIEFGGDWGEILDRVLEGSGSASKANALSLAPDEIVLGSLTGPDPSSIFACDHPDNPLECDKIAGCRCGRWIGADNQPRSIRQFPTGATRDTADGKLDFDGFFSPAVLERRAQFMHKHRVQSDGTLRASNNWQKGIPRDEYMKSAWRHFFSWWRGHHSQEDVQEEICALMFNAEGYLAELLKESTPSRASESPAP